VLPLFLSLWLDFTLPCQPKLVHTAPTAAGEPTGAAVSPWHQFD
jgi:hypothetical protein